MRLDGKRRQWKIENRAFWAPAIVYCLFSLYAVAPAQAATITAASCNTTDVQAAINASSRGDTVTIPAGTCTWTSGVTISGKGIVVQGAGSSRIIGISSNTLSIRTGALSLNITGTNVGVTSPNPKQVVSLINGQTLTVSELGTETNTMTGTVTSFNSGTGALVMNITSAAGTCGSNSLSNCKRWIVSTPATTTLINNDQTDWTLFNITEDTSFHTNISGITFGIGTSNAYTFNIHYASGGQAVLIHDCRISANPNNPLPPTYPGGTILLDTNRGVIWNCSLDQSPFVTVTGAYGLAGIVMKDVSNVVTNSWTTASNWGMTDITGQSNIYIEDSDFHAIQYPTSADDNARMVSRYNLYNNSDLFVTHGADTSPYGQRYFELYNNVAVFNGYNDGTTFNLVWWIYSRGGTFIVHDNIIPPMDSTDYPNKPDIAMTVMNLQRNSGPNPCWGAGTSTPGQYYHVPRQIGMGYVTGTGTANYPPDGVSHSSTDSITYVGDSEPIYIWNNSRTPLTNINISDYGSGGGCTNPDTSANYIVSGRDYFNGSTPKPGYTPYTYPHPLDVGGSNPPVITSIIAAPASITNGQSSTLDWIVSNATSVVIDKGVGPVVSTFTVVSPVVTTTYTLTAYGVGGKISQSVTVTVTQPPTELWSGILDPSRAIDWSQAGIPGGVPSGSWAQCGSTIQASTYGNGSGDATGGIQAALNSCSSGHVVSLGSGTFRLNGVLSIPGNVSLRGQGADQTVLSIHSTSGSAAITMGTYNFAWPRGSNDVLITGGAAAGSTSITVGNASGITVGSYLQITELNDPRFVSITGDEGSCTWCDNGYNGARVLGQIAQVTSVSGTTIGISPPLYRSYNNSLPDWVAGSTYPLNAFINPAAQPTHSYQQTFSNSNSPYWCTSGSTEPTWPTNGSSVTDGNCTWLDIGATTTTLPKATPFAMTSYAGIENLQIYANNTGAGSNIAMTQCAYCWVSGVENNYTDGDHVDVSFGYHDEIVNSYFSNSFLHTPGIFDSDIALRNVTTASLVQNNIMERNHASVMLEWGAAGNVVAYNYMFGNWDVATPNALFESIDFHGAHPEFNLFEGNIGTAFEGDSIWGSNSTNTSFRDWYKGATKVCNPLSGRGTANCSPMGAQGGSGVNGWWAIQFLRASQFGFLSPTYNLVGGIMGSLDMANLTHYNDGTTPLAQVSEAVAVCGPAPCGPTLNYDGAAYAITLGFWDSGIPSNDIYGSIIPYNTFFEHGEYTSPSGAFTWASGVTHSLPASFYLSSKPSWFGNAHYPAIGPDVAGGLANAFGHAYAIPAEVCYEQVMGGTDGTGSPLPTFNADKCYAGGGGGPLTTVYISQSGAGTQDGSSCTNPMPVTFFNSSTNWSSTPTSGKIGPGTIVHLCGTFTSSAQAGNVLTVQGSGTAGNPITILFEPGAQMNSTGWWGASQQFSNGCGISNPSYCYGAITAIGKNYITVDGGMNPGQIPQIQNMLAGCVEGAPNQAGTSAVCLNNVSATCPGGTCTQSPSAQGTGSVGVFMSDGDHDILRNLTVKNIYIGTGNSASVNDDLGMNTVDLVAANMTNLQVYGNTLNDAYYGVAVGGTNPNGINDCPGKGLCVYNNTIEDHCHHLQVGGSDQSSVNIYNNDIEDWHNWWYPTATTNAFGCHTDGIQAFGNPGAQIIMNAWNNIFKGDIGVGNATGMVFYCGDGHQDGSGAKGSVFNNLFVSTGNMTSQCSVIFVNPTTSSDNTPIGPLSILNNTFINGGNQIFLDNATNQNQTLALTIKNNLFVGSTVYPGSYYLAVGNSGAAWSSLTMDNNVYWNDRGQQFNIGSSWDAIQGGGNASTEFQNWKNYCNCDASSKYGDPKLDLNYIPQSGSAAFGVGANLISVGLIPLDSDKAGVARPSTGTWISGANNSAGGAGGPLANVFITPDGNPTGTCTTNVQTPAYFNNKNNWDTNNGPIGKGTTVHLCGTFTFPQGSSGLTVQGSGASGNPVIIQFEPNAILQSNAFGPASTIFPNTAGGALVLDGVSYVTVDGKGTGTAAARSPSVPSTFVANGIIQNLLNGSPGQTTCLSGTCTVQQSSLGIWIHNTTGVTIQNLEVRNIYMDLAGEQTGGATGAAWNTANLFANGPNTNLTIQNDVLDDAHTGAWISFDNGNTTLALSNNQIAHHGWQVSWANGSSATNSSSGSMNGNEVTNWSDWNGGGAASYHADGIIEYTPGGAPTFNPLIYNNYFHGDLDGGTGSGTALIYCALTGGGSTAYPSSTCTAFNNIIDMSGTTHGAGAIWVAGKNGQFYNNTILGPSNVTTGNSAGFVFSGGTSATLKNNIVSSVQFAYFDPGPYGTIANEIAVSDHNDFYNCSNCFAMATPYATLSAWQTGTGLDGSSIPADPLVNSSTYLLGAGSPVINLGANLTGLNIPLLDFDKANLTRPSTGPWTSGAYNYTGPVGPLTDVYISQSGTGGGTSCSDPKSVSFFNAAGNWGTGNGQIAPGTTVHLCGTFTGTAGQQLLSFQGSGTSGNPITLKFESGAQLNAPYWSANGAINCSNRSYITVDGGTNGLIQNTANGTSLANHQVSSGFYGANCTHSEVKNLTVKNIYINQGSNSGATDVAGNLTTDIVFNGNSTGSIADNNTVSQAKTGIGFWPDANGDASNIQIFGNTVSDTDWGINVGGGDAGDTINNISIHDNNITNWTNWQFPTNAYHQDGIILFNVGNPSAGLTATVYNNYIHGDLGVGSPTGFIYCADNASCKVFNNLLVNTGHVIYGLMWLGSSATTGETMNVYNNTIVGATANDTCVMLNLPGQAGQAKVENNICTGPSGMTVYGTYLTCSAFNAIVATSNHNDWNVGTGPACGSQLDGSRTSYTTWKNDGFDANSVQTNPNLTASYTLNSGSPAIGLGANLTSLNIPSLDIDKTGVTRPASGPWDAGAYQYSSGTSYSACDLDHNNVTNVLDVQLEVNMALTVTPCTGDINGDGACNVIDVQRIINAALGGLCDTGP